MENLIIGEGSLEINEIVKHFEKCQSYHLVLRNWKKFGRDLEVYEANLLELERKLGCGTLTFQDVPHDILSLWKADKGSSATLKVLCEALGRSKIRDIPESLEKAYWLEAIKSLKMILNDNIVTLGNVLIESDSSETYLRIYNALKKTKSTQPIQLIKKEVNPKAKIQYYVQRELSYMNQVDEKIFRADKCKHSLFLVKGITKYELAKLSGHKSIDVSGNQLRKITVRFMVLEHDDDYDKICKKSKDPVHLIEQRFGSYFWARSNKCLDIIHHFLIGFAKIYDEDELVRKFQTPPAIKAVSISDSPGMGKSFLLSNLATKLKENNNAFVMLLVLDEFTQRVGLVDSPSTALAAIASYACSSKLEELILKEMLKTHSFDLCLDGYDEVMLDKLSMVDAFLKQISSLKNIRVFVTTRPHLRPRLENVLNVMSHEILPFDKIKQVQFLTKYWATKGAVDGERLQIYAKDCLERLHNHMTDMEWEIAGIPLQCRILADVYAEDAERASKVDAESTSLIRIHSFFDAYKTLVNFKFARVPEDSNYKLIRMWQWLRANMRMNYVNAHIHDSITLLFPEWSDKFIPYLSGFHLIDENVLYSIGLIERSPYKNLPRFVHRTFAEYLLAEYLFQNLTVIPECVQMTFGVILGGDGAQMETQPNQKRPNLYKLKYPVIAYFMNMHLKGNIKHDAIDQFAIKVSNCYNHIELDDICKGMSACAHQGLETCLNLSMKLFSHIRLAQSNSSNLNLIGISYFKYLPHFTIEGSNCVTLAKRVLDFTKEKIGVNLEYHGYETTETSCYPWIPGCTPLHVAAYYGRYNTFSYLVDVYGEQLKTVKFILHVCVQNSFRNSDSVIEYKLSIINLLAMKAKEYGNLNWLKEKLDGVTPLLEKGVHLKILQRLMQYGSNLNSVSKYGTVLHMADEETNYKELLRWILANGFNLINHKNIYGITPLMKAVSREGLEVDTDTLDLFHQAGANFDAQSSKGVSVLFLALSSNQTSAIINKILDFGGNVNHRNKHKRSAAHILISAENKFKVSESNEIVSKLNLLILRGFTLINEPDALGCTPFHLMMKNLEYLDNPQLFELFHSAGVDFNQKIKANKTNQTVLFLTIGRISCASVAKILECGADMNYTDEKKHNAAHMAIKNARKSQIGSKEIVKVLTFLIFKGFQKIDDANESGLTPLHYALELEDLDLELLQFFRDNGADFNATANDEWSVLFRALQLGKNPDIISRIRIYGGNLFHRTTKLQTALHAAALSRCYSTVKHVINNLTTNCVDEDRRTPLHYLFLDKTAELDLRILDLFHTKGANFNAFDRDGKGVLVHAIKNNFSVTTIQKLLDCGAYPHTRIPAKMGAIHTAIYEKNYLVLELLLDNVDINSSDDNGHTLLLHLVSGEFPLDLKILDAFYAKRADFNATDSFGSVLFHAIKSNKSVSIISKIIDCGGDPFYCNSNNMNAIMVATWVANLKALEFLLDEVEDPREIDGYDDEPLRWVFFSQFDDINAVDNNGNAPLHWLFQLKDKDYSDVLELLLKCDSDFNLKNKEGHVPLIKWITEGKSPFSILLKLRNLLPITAEIASDAIVTMAEQNKVEDNEFQEFLRFLKSMSWHPDL